MGIRVFGSNINRFLSGPSSLGLGHLYPTRYLNFFCFWFRLVLFSSRSVWVNNSSICKIYYVIWLRNESSSVRVFRTKRSKESEKPKNQNTKIPKIKQIPEITKYLKDQNLTREPKISNILNIFLKFEILPKTWNYNRKRESKIYNNIFILRTYMNYSNIHNMNKIFWVIWVPGV